MSPGNGPGPSGLKRKPTRVRPSLLNVTRSFEGALGRSCAVAGAGYHDATTISAASAHPRARLIPGAGYRIHSPRHKHGSGAERSSSTSSSGPPFRTAGVELLSILRHFGCAPDTIG